MAVELPTQFRRWQSDGAAPNFEAAAILRTVPMTLPQADEVLVRVMYATVNVGYDTFIARREEAGKDLKGTQNLGVDGLGQIVALGSDVTKFSVGDYVSCGTVCHFFSEYATPKEHECIKVDTPKPEYAALRVAGELSCAMLEGVLEIESGKTFFVNAACGGIGHICVQLAKLNGCHVIGVCGGEEKKAKVIELGADRVIDYREESVAGVLAKEYPSGIDYIVDNIGGEMWKILFDSLVPNGKMFCVGYISKYSTTEESPDLTDLFPAGINVPRLLWARENESAGDKHIYCKFLDPDGMLKCIERMFSLFDEGKIKVLIDQYSFENFVGIEKVVEAANYMQAGKNVGKMLIKF